MSLLKDRTNRNYVVCLFLICGCICLLFLAGRWSAVREINKMADRHNRSVADSVMEGKDIFSKEDLIFPESVFQISDVIIGFFLLLILFFMMFLTFQFLIKREKGYQKAMEAVECYVEGDFSAHLGENEEGSYAHLLSQVENLSLALQSKSEVEHQAKEFLMQRVSDISHQLKTPLAALKMYNEIMVQEPENITVVKEFAEKSMTSIERMERLLILYLKVMRIDSGNVVFEKETCRVSELVAQATELFSVRAKQEEKELIIEGADTDQIICDFEWTVEAVSNLVKNALDHTDKGGVIQISWECRPSMLRMVIKDNGCGIAPEDINFVFKRFYRSKNQKGNGIGLGLPLTKAIIEGQGGFLSLESEPGAGTTFILCFLTES